MQDMRKAQAWDQDRRALFESTSRGTANMPLLPARRIEMKALIACMALLSAAYPIGGSIKGPVSRDTSIPEGTGYSLEPSWDAPFPYRGIVEAEAQAAGVPAWILAGVINYESAWKEYARNRNTNGTMDLGIAQLNSQYLDYFAQQFNGGQWIDPFNPLVSIRIAAQYLAWNHQSFGDWEYAVAAYNCGPGRARHRPWPETTERYVREVFR
jgi:soluble lytic murein transglycosylase-like protein